MGADSPRRERARLGGPNGRGARRRGQEGRGWWYVGLHSEEAGGENDAGRDKILAHCRRMVQAKEAKEAKEEAVRLPQRKGNQAGADVAAEEPEGVDDLFWGQK